MRDGGYDAGYTACPCFWGSGPGSLVKRFISTVGSVQGWRILDLGCGEGKNAIYLARLGAVVTACDISEAALRNAQAAWPDSNLVTWQHIDAALLQCLNEEYDAVIAYGLFHCFSNKEEVQKLVNTLQAGTRQDGYHIVCVFNDRHQDLTAHPGFHPLLLGDNDYLSLYDGWSIAYHSDRDLVESHPHNNILHVHSLTRFITQKRSVL